MDNDPISDIESKQGHYDTGRASYMMLSGALTEGATMAQAFLAVAAYYCGMFASMGLPKTGEDDDE